MIDHNNKFIFIHIPKTGGSSVEQALKWIEPRHHTLKFYDKKYDIREYYKFTIVRNPWDLVVSWHTFHKKYNKIRAELREFSEWVTNGMPTHWDNKKIDGTMWGDPLDYSQWIDRFSDYDYIARTETLQADFDIICNQINIPKRVVPQLNQSDRPSYRELYTDETRQVVHDKYIKYIKYFNYKF